MKSKFLPGLALLLLSNMVFAAAPHMRHYVVEGDFDNVRADLEMAITDQGIVISSVSHISDMLARTAKAVGATKTVYKEAQSLSFCSSTVSRAMMEADPLNIVFCPYTIAIFTLPGEKDKVHIAYRRPLPMGDKTSRKAMQAVDKLLDGIVAEVMQ